MRIENRGLMPFVMGSVVALSAGLAAGQVTVLGEFSKQMNVSVQLAVRDVTSPPDAPQFFVGTAREDVTTTVKTETVLAEQPGIGNTDVEVLSVLVKEVELSFDRDFTVELGDFGEPPVFIFSGEDVVFQFRDDGSTDVELSAPNPPVTEFLYRGFSVRGLGFATIDVLGVDNPIVLNLADFGTFEVALPPSIYEIVVEDGELVQRIGLRDAIGFFDADVIGEDLEILFFPTVAGDDFTATSSIIDPCDDDANPTGTFGALAQVAESDRDPTAIGIADVDGDGDLDIVSAINTFGAGDSVTTLLNLGNGTFDDFLLPQFAPIASGSSGLFVADVNADGIVDAVSVSTSDFMDVSLGNGDGTFTLSQSQVIGNRPEAMDGGDLNGDGHPDVVVAASTDQTLVVALNDGFGGFAIDETYPVGSTASVVVGDLNGDGHRDMAASVRFENSVKVFMNNGAGVFSVPTTLPAGQQVVDVAAGDVDGDGHTDLVAISAFDGTINVFMNNGDGTFSDFVEFPAGSIPNDVKIADIDGDTDLDVIVSSSGNDATAIVRNDGSGAFAAPEFLFGRDPLQVEVGDFDGDGDSDIVATRSNGFSGNGWDVFFNGCTTTDIPACNLADIAPPQGILDLGDIDLFIPSFLSGDAIVDFVAPFGVLDLGDIDAFIGAFLSGCS